MSRSLVVYRGLSRLPRPRSYVGKFLLVAFVGVHVPLIAVLSFVAARADWRGALSIVLVTLVATLVGTLATLVVQGRLLAPLVESSRALQAYVERRELPSLPTGFGDEAGLLMRHTHDCVHRLEELLRLKNDLLATLSHDARSPLASIRFASQVGRMALSDATPDLAELEEMFAIIDASAERQATLLETMLTLARANSGRLTVERGRVPPGELVRRVADLFRIQAEQKGVELVVELPDRPVPALLLDAGKTEQVVSNLVSNALKFTPRGGRVTLGLRADGEEVAFAVRDTGMGIPPALREKLFAPFSSAQRPGTEKEAGTGLGLWICRTFTELQGGRVELESAEGRGSEFVARFPIAAEALAEPAARPVVAGALAAGTA